MSMCVASDLRERLSHIRLAAFDLDGTLMCNGRPIPPRTVRALQALREKGIYVVVSTGRDLAQLSENVRSCFDYSISANGSLVQKGWGEEAERIAVHPMSPEELSLCLRAVRRGHGGAFLFRFGQQAGNRRSERVFSKLIGVPLKKIDKAVYSGHLVRLSFADKKRVNELPTGKIQGFFLSDKDRQRARSFLEKKGGLEVLCMYGTELELTARGVTKARGLGELCASLGLARENVIAFGDSRNDLEMLQAAGIAVAMQNGDDFIREQADLIAPDVAVEGAAVLLEELFGLPSPTEK